MAVTGRPSLPTASFWPLEIEINMWKTPKNHVFCNFLGWNSEIDKIQGCDSIFWELSDVVFRLWNVACIKGQGKTIKMVLSWKYLYFINDTIDLSENW